ncbi:MAG: hypothetical protein AB7G34_13125 [Hyphomicrobiales bacterium]
MHEAVRQAVCDIGPIPYAWDAAPETSGNRIDTLDTVLGLRIANAKMREWGCTRPPAPDEKR